MDKALALQRNKITVDTAKMIRNSGIAVEIVSAGSTGTCEVTGTYPGITEIQPGSFVFGVGTEGTGYGWGTYNDVYFKSSSQFSHRLLVRISIIELLLTQG